jgi:hypothetical protein
VIDYSKSSIASKVRGEFVQLLDELTNQNSGHVVLSHFGLINQDLANDLADGVEQQLRSTGEDKRIIQRIFTIIVEGCQNVRIHGEKDDFGHQLAFVFLSRNKGYYRLIFGNLMKHQDRESLFNYIRRINAYSEQELDALYAKVIHLSFLSKKDGAGLGLLLMRMRSGNELQTEFITMNEQRTLFCVKARINRT